MYARIDYNVNNAVIRKGRGLKKVRGSKSKIKNKSKVAEYAVKSIMKTSLESAQVLNSKVGSYTGNKIKTQARGDALKYTSYMITASVNPYVAIGAMAIDVGNSLIDYTIRNINSAQETEYKSSYYGKMATSKSRWRGNYQ